MNTLPQRFQRKRQAGSASPDNTVYVGRPTVFGNPFNWKEVGRSRAKYLYSQWLAGDLDDRYPDLIDRRHRLLQKLPGLRGKNLSCWCPEDADCHADVLLEMTNK